MRLQFPFVQSYVFPPRFMFSWVRVIPFRVCSNRGRGNVCLAPSKIEFPSRHCSRSVCQFVGSRASSAVAVSIRAIGGARVTFCSVFLHTVKQFSPVLLQNSVPYLCERSWVQFSSCTLFSRRSCGMCRSKFLNWVIGFGAKRAVSSHALAFLVQPNAKASRRHHSRGLR